MSACSSEAATLQRILVTGATGFVGSHALEALAQRPGVRLIAACRDPARLPAGFTGEVRSGDLRDPGYRASLLDQIDTLVLAAGWSSLWGHAQLSRQLHLAPTLALIDEARRAGIRRVVNISTTSAAAPDDAADPHSAGIDRPFWPHLMNVIRIENALRELAGPGLTVVNLRLGLFAGRRYGLGLLPILLPRLKTHLVPWIDGGRTSLPIVDGRDIGQAVSLAALTAGLNGWCGFNIVGPEVPTARQVLTFLEQAYGYPTPHFSVPFPVAYGFAWLMEKIDPLVPWEPLVTRSIVHLLEEVSADNTLAREQLGYRPVHHWRDAIRDQLSEMSDRQLSPMSMTVPIR